MTNSAASSIVFVLGAPGSGKGTLCKKLSEEYKLKHLSIGDVLRHIVASRDAGKEIINSMQAGELVLVEALVPILQSQIEEANRAGFQTVLVDGFPRRLDQVAAVEAIIGSPVLVLHFDCPEHLAQERFLTRKLAGRETDDEQLFQKRYKEFSASNPIIIKHYQTRDLVLGIDTSGKTEVSYQKLMNALRDTKNWERLVGT
ncbi:P-loop containing nucleoside triphosphate hydrolase protein [Phaeosphaeriaceae sp. PMI808]|nr:P-loop containing nucleoside triphosphate hydrolase protein [Phaeosphaeriaceae sp. PMI808]